MGRGAILVDTTSRPTGEGNPFIYLAQGGVKEIADEDLQRMVERYDPSEELIISLLKRRDRISTYRIQLPEGGREG